MNECFRFKFSFRSAEKAIELSHSSATLNEKQGREHQKNVAEKVKKRKGVKIM